MIENPCKTNYSNFHVFLLSIENLTHTPSLWEETVILENIYPVMKKSATWNGSLITKSLVNQEGSVPWQVGIVLLPELGDDSVIPTITCGGNIKFNI